MGPSTQEVREKGINPKKKKKEGNNRNKSINQW